MPSQCGSPFSYKHHKFETSKTTMCDMKIDTLTMLLQSLLFLTRAMVNDYRRCRPGAPWKTWPTLLIVDLSTHRLSFEVNENHDIMRQFSRY
jgi:hypothetical protein